jgi:hypothetical protein
MRTTKEAFLSHYIPLFIDKLKENLPDSALVTQMLLHANAIIRDFDAHIIAGIHKNLQTAKEEVKDGTD